MSTPVLDAVREALTRIGRTATHAAAPLAEACGVPVIASHLIPEGQAYVPAGTRTWLGEPIHPWPLKVAARHYAQQDTP